MRLLSYKLLSVLHLTIICEGIWQRCVHDVDCSGRGKCVPLVEGNVYKLCQCDKDEIVVDGKCSSNDGRCKPDEQLYFGGRCYAARKIGKDCKIDDQCVGDAKCAKSICSCPKGSTSDTRGEICLIEQEQSSSSEKLKLRSANQVEISANYSKKSNSNESESGSTTQKHSTTEPPKQTTLSNNCASDQVPVNGECLSLRGPGEECKDSVQCVDGSSCSDETKRCVCPSGKYIMTGYCRKLSSADPCDQSHSVFTNGHCEKVQQPGRACSSNEQCLGGSVCEKDVCSCRQGTELYRTYCVPKIEVVCLESQVLLNNICYDKVQFGQSCSVTDQCPGNSVCSYTAKCECPLWMELANDVCKPKVQPCTKQQIKAGEMCIDRVAPGKSCLLNSQCLDQSSCVKKICTCDFGLENRYGYCVGRGASQGCSKRMLMINEKCFSFAPPGYHCAYNQQCLASSTCLNGTCTCIPGYTNVFDYCVKENETTQCRSNQVVINGLCYDYSNVGQYCVDSVQCQRRSICMNNYCVCPSGKMYEGNECGSTGECWSHQVRINSSCYDKIKIGGRCEHSEQCINNSICESNVCKCPSGVDLKENYCVRHGGCDPSQVDFDGNCLEKKHFGEACKYSGQCLSGSSCENGLCSCPSGTTYNKGWCVRGGNCNSSQILHNGYCYDTVEFGQFCYLDIQCSQNSSCIENHCRCREHLMLTNGVCANNTNCRPYQISINGVCMDTVSIGMSCMVDSQCIGSAECVQDVRRRNKTCQCKDGTLYTGSSCSVTSSARCPPSTVYASAGTCQTVVPFGQFCESSTQCMGFSACIGFLCTCPTGYQRINDACRDANAVNRL